MLKSQVEEINVGVLPIIANVMAFVSYCHVQKTTLLCLYLSLSPAQHVCHPIGVERRNLIDGSQEGE